MGIVQALKAQLEQAQTDLAAVEAQKDQVFELLLCPAVI
jgi:hypothetical protein